MADDTSVKKPESPKATAPAPSPESSPAPKVQAAPEAVKPAEPSVEKETVTSAQENQVQEILDEQKSESNEDIDEIMEELEQLEKEIGSTVEEDSASEPTDEEVEKLVEEAANHLSDFHAEGEDASMEETLGGLGDEEFENENSLLNDSVPESSNVVPIKNAESFGTSTQVVEESRKMSSGEEGCLTLSLKGNMKLNLTYEASGKVVTVGFDDEHLTVTLTDGTEFRVPVKRESIKKVA